MEFFQSILGCGVFRSSTSKGCEPDPAVSPKSFAAGLFS